jgi:hypothetical protein
MILSKEKKLAFIHIWKTAGTSLRSVLADYSSHTIRGRVMKKLNIPQALLNDPYKRFYDVHTSYSEISEILGEEELNSLYTFGVVRNPWDWHVSLYHYMQQQSTHYQNAEAVKFNDFEYYLKWRLENEVIDQRHFLVDKNDIVAVNYIGRFEALDQVMENLKNVLRINAVLPKKRASKHEDYRKYYKNDGMIDCVAKMNEKDITEFKYDFE